MYCADRHHLAEQHGQTSGSNISVAFQVRRTISLSRLDPMAGGGIDLAVS